MKDFKKNDRFGGGGRGKFGGGGGRSFGNKSFGNKPFGRPDMHKATCANCGKECEVPFRPTGDKPVYCRDCFGGAKAGAPADSYQKREFRGGAPSFDRPRTDDRRLDDIKILMQDLNSKLDRIIRIMEKVPEVQVAAPTLKETLKKAGVKTVKSVLAKKKK